MRRWIVGMLTATLAGCGGDEVPTKPVGAPKAVARPDEFPPGGEAMVYDPEDRSIMAWGVMLPTASGKLADNFRPVAVGTKVRVVGEVAPGYSQAAPTYRVTVLEGEFTGLVCKVERKNLRPMPAK